MDIIVTLYEGNYQYGVGALINSIVNSNFKGKIYIGYRGNLPLWVNQLEKLDNCYKVDNNVYLTFVILDVSILFRYYKPSFMKKIIEEYPGINNIYYFDPDIVINAPWTFISSWTNIGVSVCLDNCYPFVHQNHPWRKEWQKLANDTTKCELNYYVNAGFIGINSSSFRLLDRWISITENYKAKGGDLTKFKRDGFRAIKGDQDLLNAAMTISSDINFSIIGTEGMGFTYPTYLMAHAVEIVKPWNNKFIKQVIFFGLKPSAAAKYFFKYCEYPINVFTNYQLLIKKMDIKIASIIGRVFA